MKYHIKQQGIRYFKVKISGDVEADLRRLARLRHRLRWLMRSSSSASPGRSCETGTRLDRRVSRQHPIRETM